MGYNKNVVPKPERIIFKRDTNCEQNCMCPNIFWLYNVCNMPEIDWRSSNAPCQ